MRRFATRSTLNEFGSSLFSLFPFSMCNIPLPGERKRKNFIAGRMDYARSVKMLVERVAGRAKIYIV